MIGNFLRTWTPAETCLQSRGNTLDSPALNPNGAGRGVAATEIVEDRSPNPENRIGAEGQTAIQIEAIEGFHQSERTGAHQLTQFHRWNSAGDITRHVVNQAQV